MLLPSVRRLKRQTCPVYNWPPRQFKTGHRRVLQCLILLYSSTGLSWICSIWYYSQRIILSITIYHLLWKMIYAHLCLYCYIVPCTCLCLFSRTSGILLCESLKSVQSALSSFHLFQETPRDSELCWGNRGNPVAPLNIHGHWNTAALFRNGRQIRQICQNRFLFASYHQRKGGRAV